jgi:hypothetical protein
MPYCPECGKPVSPNAKFCRNCGVSQLEEPAIPATVPEPTHKITATCASCSAPVLPEEKFCGNCGRPVSPPAADPQVPPQPAPQPPPLTVRVCNSCGCTVGPETKFCGNCGKPVCAPAAGPQVPSQPAPQPAPVSGAAPPIAASPSSPPAQREKIVGIIANAKKSKMFGAAWDTYSLVVTERRMIVAQLTQQMINAAIAEAQAKSREQGNGFFGAWADQLAATFQYAVRYETMSPDTALAETPGNFAIENSQITVVDLSLRDHEDSSSYREFKLVIKSVGGKFEFMIAEDDRFINILKTAYGPKVSMPFGYHKMGDVRIKFF